MTAEGCSLGRDACLGARRAVALVDALETAATVADVIAGRAVMPAPRRSDD